MGKKWTPEQREKFKQTMAAKRTAPTLAEQKKTIKTKTNGGAPHQMAVLLPEFTGFALNTRSVKLAVQNETRLEVLAPGRGNRPMQQFVVQLPRGAVVQATETTRKGPA